MLSIINFKKTQFQNSNNKSQGFMLSFVIWNSDFGIFNTSC